MTVPLYAEEAASAAQPHEFHASNDVAVAHNTITGPGKASSSLTEGLNFLETLNVYGNGRTAKGWDYNYAAGLKATDDRTMDPKTVSLTNLSGRATNGVHTLNLGDTFESFSQYALATSLKGGTYRYAKPNSRLPEIIALHGLAYPRWDSLWKDPDTRTIKRQGTGVRIKENIAQDLWAGASYVGTKDTDPLTPTDSLYEAKNYSFDFNAAPMPGLTMNGEYSMADARETTTQVTAKGHAARFEIVGDADPSRVSLEYENVEPDFFSALGSATPDRQKAKGKWKYKATNRLTVNSSLLWFRDNLDGQKAAGTTQNWKPELSVGIKKPFASRPRSHADLGYRFDRRYGAGTSTMDHYLTANYRDRHGEIDSDTNLGYTLYETKTNVRDASEMTFNTSLNSRHSLASVVLKPSLKLGAWQAQDDLADATDTVYDYSLGLGLEAPNANVTGDLRFGQNKLKKEKADDSDKMFATLAAYWRPKLLAKLNESTLYLRANYNDFSFTTDTRNFREKSVTAGLITSF